MDGANALQRFRNITLPAIFLVAAPTFVTQYTGNFNNFSMIYLFNEGGPGSLGGNAGSTDILISWIYKLTTGGSPQYSIASALTLIISFVVISISLLVFKRRMHLIWRIEDEKEEVFFQQIIYLLVYDRVIDHYHLSLVDYRNLSLQGREHDRFSLRF